MNEVCVFVKYNSQWNDTLRYVGGEMKGILVLLTATYVGLIELVRSVIGIRGLDKTIVMRYAVEPRMPPVMIQCDTDVKFYIQLKNKDVHVLSKFPISIDVLDESTAEAMPLEVGESYHIDVQPSRAWRGKEAALTSLSDDDVESYKVIVVDGPALKAKFGGMLLAACGHDANGSIFPLAFGPLKTYFDGASRSYLVSEHQRLMESIRNCNPDMHRYLVQTDPTKWSRAYFNGRRYAIMTTNITESLNSVDRKVRLMPVGFLVEWLRELIQRWLVERREEALKKTLKLAPKAEKLIHTNFSFGLTVMPRPADQFEYAITKNDAQTWIIDMSERTCTCRRFQVDLIPCPHAMAVSQRAVMLLKKSDCKLSILPIQSIVPEGHGFVGFCPKVKNMRLFGVVDVMVIDTTGKPVLTQYRYAYVQQQGPRHR
ncbi:hypothetical protein TIFTF001_023684 [Ficus carica]|uniref:SWIM-type domain-containing protein n=1 Tax=Ficus carica TaxID=3494 RepID=A0AA88DK83_FICCA|nr:hypothetical protein TIFTF001_023684 [Ficus carica]